MGIDQFLDPPIIEVPNIYVSKLMKESTDIGRKLPQLLVTHY